MTILVIVESPAKIKKIQGFLGDDYVVTSSEGHFRDLKKNTGKDMGIDFNNNYEPIYEITKPHIVKNIKELMIKHKIDTIYIGSDLDLEGTAIGQSMLDVFKPKHHKRLIFNSITKDAILNSIKTAGPINKNDVNAQKARRVIDRLFGYSVSPLVKKHLSNPALSAGRVQSPTLKLVVEKEREIKDFLEEKGDSSHFKIRGTFDGLHATLQKSLDEKPYKIKSEYKGENAHLKLSKDKDNPNGKVIIFLKRCLKSTFKVQSITEKFSYRSPSPPFITSTLQQEANRKFGMQIDTTMKIAQKLYEAGLITYMRTDSVAISPEGHKEIKKVIVEDYGKDYYEKIEYKNKNASAQEAHEAIRPVHPETRDISSDFDEFHRKLYKLIWQRAVASQMAKAKIKLHIIQISISKFIEDKIDPFYYFQSVIEKIIFPGFMKVYVESLDDQEKSYDNQENGDTQSDFTGKLPKVGSELDMEEIVAKQEFARPPPRYTEASLVKKIESLGIGRPSTYVPTVKRIMDKQNKKEYIKLADIPGVKKDISILSIKSDNGKHLMKINEVSDTVLLGKEKNKLIPTAIGYDINDYLVKNFPDELDYKFTSKLESELDEISEAKKIWYKVVDSFYKKIKPKVDTLSAEKIEDTLLGTDSDGNKIYVSRTMYGPVVKKIINDKSIYAKIIEPYDIKTITLDQAKELFKYPKLIGKYKDLDVMLYKGQYGLYLMYNKKAYAIPKDKISETDILDLNDAIEIIKEKDKNNLGEHTVKIPDPKDTSKTKKVTVTILEGPYGPYLTYKIGTKKNNRPIPKDIDPKKISDEDIIKIITTKREFKKFTKNKTGGKDKKINKVQNKTPKAGSKKTGKK